LIDMNYIHNSIDRHELHSWFYWSTWITFIILLIDMNYIHNSIDWHEWPSLFHWLTAWITFIILLTRAGRLDPSNVFCRQAISYSIQPSAQMSDLSLYGLPSHWKVRITNQCQHFHVNKISGISALSENIKLMNEMLSTVLKHCRINVF
jgi:hypothetical protein